MDLIMLTGGVAVWAVLFACAWLYVIRSGTPPDDPEAVVAVQRHGRTHFVRRDVLDMLDGHPGPSRWERMRARLIASPGTRLRAVIMATLLAVLALLGLQQLA